MTKTIFREAQPADLPGIVALLADDELGSMREDTSLPLQQDYLDAFAAIQSDPNQLLLVSVSDEVLMGCVQISFIPGLSHRGAWRGQIESVRTAAHARGQGLGKRMLEHAIKLCRELGCQLVQLTTDKRRPRALAFYQGLGFEASHEGMKLKLS